MKIFVALTAIILAATPAQAGKYGCSFLSGSSVIKQCEIESGGSNRLCVHPHSATLQGACFVDPSGSSDRLQCVYLRGDGNVAELTKQPAVTSIQANVGTLTERPGFIAGGVTLGVPTGLVLVAGYRESNTVPLLQVICTPKR